VLPRSRRPGLPRPAARFFSGSVAAWTTRGNVKAISSRAKAARNSTSLAANCSSSSRIRSASGDGVAAGRPAARGSRRSSDACNTRQRSCWKRGSLTPSRAQASCVRQAPAKFASTTLSRSLACAEPGK